jgi:hypothetical protein
MGVSSLLKEQPMSGLQTLDMFCREEEGSEYVPEQAVFMWPELMALGLRVTIQICNWEALT